jgi:hypothetical protein
VDDGIALPRAGWPSTDSTLMSLPRPSGRVIASGRDRQYGSPARGTGIAVERVAKMSIPAGRKRLTAVFRAAATEQPDATRSGSCDLPRAWVRSGERVQPPALIQISGRRKNGVNLLVPIGD